MVSPAQGRRPSHLGVEASMISKGETKRRKLAEFLFRSTCAPTGHDRHEPRPDSNGQCAESQLHRYRHADTVARHRMSKMTNENGTPQIPDILNSADLSRRDISPRNTFCPSSVVRGPILRARTGAIGAKQ